MALTLALGLLAATPFDARADPENARDHLKAGLALAEKGEWEKALVEFEEAHHLDPQPTTLFDVAQARMKTERYRAAIEAYRALLAAKSALSSHQLSVAQRQLAIAESKVARLSVTTSALPAKARVTVDDQAMPRSPVVVDPGPHVVRAYEDERLLVEHRVELGEGSETTLDLREAKTAPVAARSERPAPPQRERSSSTHWIVFGTSAALLGVGAIFAIKGYGAWSDLKGGCGRTRTCPEDEVTSARRDVIVGDVTIGVGIVGAAIGTVLFLLERRDSARRSAWADL